MNRKKLTTRRNNRKIRVRNKLKSKSSLPRLVVTKSLKHISAQVIDAKGNVLVSATSKNQTFKDESKTEQAGKIGQLIAIKLKKKKISAVVFDRGHYKYHGRIKALAEAAMKGQVQDRSPASARLSKDPSSDSGSKSSDRTSSDVGSNKTKSNKTNNK